jgi:multidrug resistance efflux pump
MTTSADKPLSPDADAPLQSSGIPAQPVASPPFNPWPLAARVAITLAVLAIALLLGRAMWNVYMGAPWTPDASVRAYVVTVAPEVSGNIVALPVTDNQQVRKGDLLMQIDPTNYKIALDQAAAAVEQAKAAAQNVDAQTDVQRAQITANKAQVDQAQAALTFASEQAVRYSILVQKDAGSLMNAEQYQSQQKQAEAALATAQATLVFAQRQIESLTAQKAAAEANIAQANARLEQARTDLSRTEIRSPVNGWITNLIAQSGNYAVAAKSMVSIVDGDSFWVDAYFEETQFGRISIGDKADIKLMGYDQVIPGVVDGVARAINVPNATPDEVGVATVNPIFTWVRLAQRIPTRIVIGKLPDKVTLVAGMTATVQVNEGTAAKSGASN